MDSRVAAILSFIHLSCVSVQSLLPRNLLYGHRLRSNIALHLVRPSSFQFELYKKKAYTFCYGLRRRIESSEVILFASARLYRFSVALHCAISSGASSPQRLFADPVGALYTLALPWKLAQLFVGDLFISPPGFRWSCRSFQGYPQSCVTCFDPRGASSLPAVRS